MRTKYSLIIPLLFSVLLFGRVAYAQNQPKVDYGNQPVVDSDLDGLTDQGEIQIYHTDPHKADTDGDGWEDGVEVMSGTDPLDPNSYPGAPASVVQQAPSEIPWAWYAARAAGLVSFALLWVSIFLGLTLRIPLLRKIFSPIYSMSVHCWISLYATIFALAHGMVLIFDKQFHFGIADVLVPFASSYEPGLIAMGIFTFYLMVLLVVTSYGRRFISQKVWRATHFMNIALYAFGLVHAYNLGTDMKNPIVSGIFILANALLIFIMLWSLEMRIADSIMRKRNQAKLAQNDNIQADQQ
ncbi:MAG TPA: ferric reductase-like transmembrane domain-containing protein [Patescibacteria group bacterium]